ncbi:MAG TPA: tetratricopeptide repeat protein [Chthoniobacteraceae bacterium]|nr:tetratricopeptide repeat protein [Chthoniobacteraceae bacterium]
MAKIGQAVLLAIFAAGWMLFTPPLAAQDAKAAFQRGVEASSKGDGAQAIASFSEAIAKNPDYAAAYNNRGDIYKAQGNFEKAMADYNSAIHVDPKYVPAYINRGILLSATGDAVGAMKDYDEALLIEPGNALAYVNRGLLRESAGDYRKAILDFESALQADPANGLARNNLAWVLATCPQAAFRDGKKAVEFATKACESAQWKNLDYVDTLAAAYAEVGDFAQAVKWESQYLAAPALSKAVVADAAARLKLYQSHQPYRSQ